ncbi:MAG: copper chaperone PCu(A)C [Rhodoferax sp.]|nr:copper chaperone PCu(A)C [Rhodoferax sp.]
MKLLRFRWVALALWLGATVAAAQVKVEEAWVRATVPGQQAAGAFMKITSTEPAKLVSVASSVSKFSEIHVMKMDGGVMKMRTHTGGLEIPANTTVVLGSGGYHVMLMDLSRAVRAGETMPLTIRFSDASGKETAISVDAKASFMNPYKQ